MKHLFFALCTALPALPNAIPAADLAAPVPGRAQRGTPLPVNGVLFGAGVLLIGALRIRPE